MYEREYRKLVTANDAVCGALASSELLRESVDTVGARAPLSGYVGGGLLNVLNACLSRANSEAGWPMQESSIAKVADAI